MEGTIGFIKMFGGNFAPKNWSLCRGQIIAISSNTALFSILGTTYGGDGRTTFQLPDLQGRAPIGQGNGPGLAPVSLGERAGVQTVTLNIQNIPQHAHTLSQAQISVNSGNGESSSPVGAVIAGSPGAFGESFGANQFLAPNSITGNTDMAGSGIPLNILNPSVGLNYIICQYGIFPARN